jgi:adenylate cyclase
MIKYLGDGILAVFSSETVQNSEERAVDVARELIKRMQPTGPLDDSRSNIIGVAINTGMAAVGYVGVDENVEFNVVGDIVNVTYRLQDYSYPFKIIAGDETVAGLGPDYKHKVAGSVRMTGRQTAIQVHEVVPG